MSPPPDIFFKFSCGSGGGQIGIFPILGGGGGGEYMVVTPMRMSIDYCLQFNSL